MISISIGTLYWVSAGNLNFVAFWYQKGGKSDIDSA